MVTIEEHSKIVKLFLGTGKDASTPLALVQDMISKIPDYILQNPSSTFLDPCAGTGSFAVCLYHKLKEYHSHDHIVGSMLYLNDITERSSLLYKKLGFKNIYRQNALELDMKFDVVIGNPPYQKKQAVGEDGKKIRKNDNKPLWFFFVEEAFKLCREDGLVAFVTPVSWIQYTCAVNKHITSRQLQYAEILPSNTFKGVGTTASYWIAKNKRASTDINNITVEGTSYAINTSSDLVPSSTGNYALKLSILRKTMNNTDLLKFDIRTTGEHSTGSKAAQLSAVQTDTNIFPVFHTNSQTLWSSVAGSLHGIPKVVISKTGSLVGAHYNPAASISQIAVALIVGDEAQGNVATALLSSKFYKYLISSVRSNSTISSDVLKSLPAVDLTRTWTDQELYQHFNLTEEEIQHIESTIN